MKAKQAYKLVDQLRNPGPRNYYIDCFPEMEPPDNYNEIFECLRSHTIGEAYADKMLLLLLMLVSQYETHIFLDHDLAKENYPDLLDQDLTKLPVADLLEISKKLIVTDHYLGVNVLFKDKKYYSLLRIESGIDADLYKLSKKAKKLVNKLLKRNGLFLVKY